MITRINALAMRPRGNASRRGSVLQGCLIALAVVVALIIAGIVVVAVYWRSWTASGVTAAVEAALQDAPIAEAEKAEIQTEIDQLMTGFKDGDVTVEQLMRVMEEIAKGPLLPAAAVEGVHEGYFKPSGLTDEQKADAKLQLSRIAKGLTDETITMVDLRGILEPLEAGPGYQNGVEFEFENVHMTLKQPEDCTDEELTEFLALATALADEKQIPDQLYDIDISDEIHKAIEAAMGRSTPNEADDDASHDPDEASEETEETDDEP